MNIEFSHLELSNFLSYGNNLTKVDLSTNNPTLIVGKNFSASSDGSDSNGSGKSSILNAVCFALYDKVLSDVSKDKLINNINKKDMLVSLYFSVDNIRYKILRFRKNKQLGGDGVKIFKDGNDKWEFDAKNEFAPDSISNFNKLIVRLIGKPFEVFSRIVVFSATHMPFLSLPSSSQNDANQIAILEELFGYTEVSEKADILKEQLKENKKIFEQQKLVNDTIVAEHDRVQQQIKNLTEKNKNWIIDQKRIIQDIQTNINLLSTIDFKKQEQLFDRISQIEKEISQTQQDNINLSQKIDNYNKTIKLSKSWDDNNNISIKNIESQIEQYKNFDFDSEFEKLKQIQELDIQLTFLNNQLNTCDSALIEKSKQFSKNESELIKLSSNECPYCQQNFADAKLKHAEICNIQDILNGEITKQKTLKSNISQEIKKVQEELQSLKSHCKFSLNELTNIKNTLSNNIKTLEKLKLEKNPFIYDELFLESDAIEQNNIKIESLNSELLDNKKHIKFDSERQMIQKQSELESLYKQIEVEKSRVNPYKDSLDEMKDMKLPETKEKELDELSKLMEHQDFLVKLLTKKDSFIRKNLLQKNLPLLNNRLKIYLERMGLPHKVSFQENMSAQIKQFDTELEYNQLSSGQKARINLALCFAFRDVLQYRHGNINFCMLDECLDVGLGNTGVHLAVKLIKDIAIEQKLSLFVISHRDEASAMFSRKLEIEYRNGFSNIKEI